MDGVIAAGVAAMAGADDELFKTLAHGKRIGIGTLAGNLMMDYAFDHSYINIHLFLNSFSE